MEVAKKSSALTVASASLVPFALLGSVGPVLSFHSGVLYKLLVVPVCAVLGLGLAAWGFKQSVSELGRTFNGAAFVLHVCVTTALIFVWVFV